MIVTVTMNAAIDRTLTVPNFQPGQRHRASAGLTLAGGKGINIARALKRLDVPVVATGLAGGRTGTRVVEELTTEAILNDFVRIDGESRTSTAIVDPTGSTYTEVNEWGPHVGPEELEMLLEKLAYLSQGAEYVVFAGSLPRGIDEGFYAEAVRELNRRGAKTVLDSEGEPLRHGTQAEPLLEHLEAAWSARAQRGARQDDRGHFIIEMRAQRWPDVNGRTGERDALLALAADLQPVDLACDALAQPRLQRAGQLRVGLAYGPTVARGGDVFGRAVNLASRVTQIARAGSVLATRDVRDRAGTDRFHWSSAHARRLKGLPDPVPLYRARPPAAGS